MEYYGEDELRNFLSHHGILGMHWGKKNGPPYPLGAGDHSASEKKEGWRKSLGGGRNEELYDRKEQKDRKTNKWDKEVFSGEVVTRKHLRFGKENTIAALKVAGAVAVTGLVAYGAYKYSKDVDWGAFSKAVSDPSGNKNIFEMSSVDTSVVSVVEKTPVINPIHTDNSEYLSSFKHKLAKGIVDKEDIPKLFDNDQWNGLSYHQQDALYTYTTTSGFDAMNSYLRNKKPDIPSNILEEDAPELVKHATDALNQTALKRDITTFRGCGYKALNGLFGGTNVSDMTTQQMQKFIGAEVTEKGFMSTSPAGVPLGFKKKVNLVILCPEGTKGMYLAPKSEFPNEKELLLQRNTTFKVRAMQKNPDGIVNVILEVAKQVLEDEV